jgi:hypothetical protein
MLARLGTLATALVDTLALTTPALAILAGIVVF